MAERVPAYVSAFAEAILDRPPADVTMPIPGRRGAVFGHAGILAPSRIQYNEKPFNILGRSLEYTFWIEPVREYRGTEVSLQLYKNYKGYWRLFAYTRAGMLLSLNLSMIRHKGVVLELGQTIVMRAQDLSVTERSTNADMACRYLRHAGFDVSEDRELVLGTFDTHSATFRDTTSVGFVRGFLQAALIVGHFQGNKGYRLPYPRGRALSARRTSTKAALQHRISAGLRTDVLERDRSTCQKCGRTPRKHGVVLHIDHKTPFSRGGPTVLGNLWTLCGTCNRGKSNRYDNAAE